MTYPIYNQEQLETKNRNQLWAICRERGLKRYRRSADCVNAIIESQPKKLEEPSSYTLEFVGETEIQTAYNVRKEGLLIGLIFLQHDGGWQNGDGKSYADESQAIAAIDNPQHEEIYQTGTIYKGFFKPVKLWKKKSSPFYHRLLEDALNQNNPIAIQAQSLRIGDTIIVGGRTRIKRILPGIKHGVKCLKIICDNGVELLKWFYELVEINTLTAA